MNVKFLHITIAFVVTNVSLLVHGQCQMTITPNVTQTIICGESVNIVANGYTPGVPSIVDFNNSTLPPGWQTTSTAMYTNPCGPTLDGSPSAWFGNVAFPRKITSPAFDVSCGGEVCFDIDFASDDPCSCSHCEDPDLANEGVYFQYSTNGGLTWTDIYYFQPNTTNSGLIYSWNNYCFPIPPGAFSPNTLFQWSQPQASSSINDHWGIDNISITPYNCGGGYYYTWNNSLGDPDTTVTPTTNSTYNIIFTNGINDTCSSTLQVNVTPYNVYASATNLNINCGACPILLVDILNTPTIQNPNFQYSWSPTTNVSNPNIQTPTTCPGATTTYTGTVTEANSGCTGSFSFTINVTPDDPGFFYADYDHCSDAPSFLPTITGDAGGTFSSTPTGLSLDPNTGEIQPSASVAGIYDVTYQTPNPNCISDSTVTIIIYDLPPVDAGVDQTVCAGTPVVLSGSGATSYQWDNGAVDGQTFIPTATQTYMVTGTDANSCQNTDQVMITVVPVDDPSFGYPGGNAYCEDHGTILPNITGLSGGTFAYSPNTAGNVLDLNTATGEVNILNSSVGIYTVYYNTTGLTMCPDSSQLTFIIHPNPDPNFIVDTTMGCEPVEVSFISNATTTNSCLWNFGDGGTASICGDVAHTYMAGLHDVTLTVTSPQGCISSTTYPGLIDITEQPNASFYPSISTTSIEFTRIEFHNTSTSSSHYAWTFGDGSILDTTEGPVHLFPEIAGEYEVLLYAYSDNFLCLDSLSSIIKIVDAVTFYIPNTFTPNGDSKNPHFAPIFFSGYDPSTYQFSIYNRWGELIFQTTDPYGYWDGRYPNSLLVEDGVYIWRVEFGEELTDKRYVYNGHVTVLK